MNTSKAPAARRFAPLAAGGGAAGDCPFESHPTAQHRWKTVASLRSAL